MAEDNETRAGIVSGIVAIVMVVALSLMAMTVVGPGNPILNQPSMLADNRP